MMRFDSHRIAVTGLSDIWSKLGAVQQCGDILDLRDIPSSFFDSLHAPTYAFLKASASPLDEVFDRLWHKAGEPCEAAVSQLR